MEFQNQHFTLSCWSLQFQLGTGFLVRLLANKRRSSPPSVPPSFPRLTSAFLPTPQIPGPLQTHNRPECDFSVSSRLFEFPGGQQGLGSPSPTPPDLQPNARAAQLPASLHSAPLNSWHLPATPHPTHTHSHALACRGTGHWFKHSRTGPGHIGVN